MTTRKTDIMRRFDPIAPPPSPIPTGKGSRSAANETLSQNLTTQIPKLSLPHHKKSHRFSLPDIDLTSLLRREPDSVNRVLKAACGFGRFRVTGHGIVVDGVRSELMVSLDMIAGSEEFVWGDVTEPAREVVKHENWLTFSQKMENMRYELERIASALVKVFYEYSNKQPNGEELKRREPVLRIHRYNQDLSVGRNQLFSLEENNQTCKDYALSLHLPLDQCEFHVQTKQGTLSFDANHNTILVTIGKELEDWSKGEFKSAVGESIIERSFRTRNSSFSIDLKCSPPILSVCDCKISETISIADQIVLMIAIPILYKMLLFIFY